MSQTIYYRIVFYLNNEKQRILVVPTNSDKFKDRLVTSILLINYLHGTMFNPFEIKSLSEGRWFLSDEDYNNIDIELEVQL